MKMVTVLFPNINGRAIVTTDGELYIISAFGYYQNQEMFIDLEAAQAIPGKSLFLAVAACAGDVQTFKDFLKFVKEEY